MKTEKFPQSPHFLETNNDGINKLALKIKASGQVNITAKMSMFDEAPMQEAISDTPISSWTVEGDDKIASEIPKSSARLNSIKANGEVLFGFDPEIYSYKYYIGKNETETVFTAESNGNTEIVEYPQTDGSRMIEIRAYDSAGRYRPYIVRTVPYTPQYIGEYERHTVVGAEVSSEQSDGGNVRANSYDSDLNTRWSAFGRNEWMIHSLGAERKIDAVGLAFWKGSQRIFSFEIYVSSDGVNYTKVLEKETSGTTEEMEIYPLDKPVTARFVKFVGHGSNAAVNGEWGGISEETRISICVDDGHKTAKNVVKTGAFTVSIADAENVVACDYVGIVSGNKVPDKIEKAGWHVSKSEFVTAPLFEELPMALECKLISYDEGTCRLVGEIVNVCADERILDEKGKIDLNKFSPITYDPVHHTYRKIGHVIGKAFSDGLKLK